MIKPVKTEKDRARYYLEVAENCRKKAETYDKIIQLGIKKQVDAKAVKDAREKSRYWWAKHEEYLKDKEVAEVLGVKPYPEGEKFGEIYDYAKRLFKT